MDDYKVLDVNGVEVQPDVPTPPVAVRQQRATRMPKLADCAGCGTGLYQADAAKDGYCLYCRIARDELDEFTREVAVPITREAALAELRSMAHSKQNDHEGAHIYADHLILRLLGDPEIAAAWFGIDKWYS